MQGNNFTFTFVCFWGSLTMLLQVTLYQMTMNIHCLTTTYVA